MQAEGENSDDTPSQTEEKIESITPKINTASQDTQENINTSSEPRNFQIRGATIDYRKLNNPQSKLPSL